MPRVALLISGLPRQWQHCVQSQLRLFASTPFDVFFHFWDTVDAAEKQRIVAAFGPRAYRFEPPRDFSRFDRSLNFLDNINCPSRMMSMYYSWKAVSEIFAAYQSASGVQYDYAVRLRGDLMLFNTLDAALPRIGPSDLVLTNFNNFGLINDMFAIGGIAPILYYHSLYDRVPQYNSEGVHANPEYMLMRHLTPPKNTMYRVGMSDLKVLAFRPHMVGMPIDECLKQDPGANKWNDPEVVAAHARFHASRRGAEGLRFIDEFRKMQLATLGSLGKQ